MSRPQKYKPELGLQGNIEDLAWENQYSNNHIANNKAEADSKHTANEDALCEVDENTQTSKEELEEALCELDEKIEELKALLGGRV